MGSIKIGNSDMTLKLGSSAVTAAYIGSTLVYSGSTPPTPTYKWVSYNEGDEVPSTTVYGVKLGDIGLSDSISIEFGDIHTGVGFIFEDGDWVALDFETQEYIDITSYFDSTQNCYVILFSDLGYSGMPISYPQEGNQFEFDVDLYEESQPTPPSTNNIISYSADTKLAEITSTGYTQGLHINSFSGASGQKLTMLSHTFENRVGTIEFDDDIVNVGINAFYNTYITNIILPTTITTYGNYCFYQCYSLNNIELSENVVSIGNGTFRNCGTSSFYLKINAITPPALGTSTFTASYNYPIYVPASAVNTYMSASGWSNYAARIQAIPNS